MENIFDNRSVWKSIEKFILKVITILNQTIFNEDDNSKRDLNIGEQTIYIEELVKYEDIINNEKIEPLSAHELIYYILITTKKEKIILQIYIFCFLSGKPFLANIIIYLDIRIFYFLSGKSSLIYTNIYSLFKDYLKVLNRREGCELELIKRKE